MSQVQLDRTLSNQARHDRQLSWSAGEQRLHVRSDQALSDQEVEDIVAFLHALNGELPAE